MSVSIWGLVTVPMFSHCVVVVRTDLGLENDSGYDSRKVDIRLQLYLNEV